MKIRIPTCPACGSLNISTHVGTVDGFGVIEAWAKLDAYDGWGVEKATTRSWRCTACDKCLHRWDYDESDVVCLSIDRTPKTMWQKIRRALGLKPVKKSMGLDVGLESVYSVGAKA